MRSDNNLDERLMLALRNAVVEAAEQAELMARKLQGVPVGRGGGGIVRSRPGEPPRRETGRLQRSHRTEVRVTADGIRVRLYTPVRYAAFLEHGTTRMAARPTYARVRAAIGPVLNDLVRNGIRTL